MTPAEAIRALRHDGNVYYDSRRFPHLLLLNKTSFVRTIRAMRADAHVNLRVVNAENSGRYHKDRRYFVVDP